MNLIKAYYGETTKADKQKIMLDFLLWLGVFGILALMLLIPGQKAFAAVKDISACRITLSQKSFYYTGYICEPEVTIQDGGVILSQGIDYTLYGSTASTVGVHEITIIGKGVYEGSRATATFEIKKAKNKLSLDSYYKTIYTYSEATTSQIYFNDKGFVPLQFSTTTKGVSVKKDGLQSCSVRVKNGFLGTVKIKVRAEETDSYQAASATFSIEFKMKGAEISKITEDRVIPWEPLKNDHTVNVRWEGLDWGYDKIGGFQIRYSMDRNFKSKVYKVKTPMVVFMGIPTEGCTFSKHLSRGKTFYFQLRTYKKALNGKTYYSDWSKTVAHKVGSSGNSGKEQKPKNGKSYQVDGITYIYKDKKLTASGIKFTSHPNQIVIPDKVTVCGKKYPVTAIKKGAFCNALPGKQIRKISIGKYVSSIGQKAFADNGYVSEITIKSQKLNGKSFGKSAFRNTGKLVSSIKLKAPASRKAEYKRLLKKAGLTKRLR